MTPTASYFLLEGFAIAFFGILGVQNLAHRDERLRMILGSVLIYWMAQYIYALVFTSNILHGLRHRSHAVNVVDMSAEPTCCFLLLELCRPGWLNWRRAIINMALFVVLGGLYFATGQDVVYQIMLAFFVAYGIGVFVATMYYIPKYNQFLREHYSYDEVVNLNWLYYVLLTFFVLMLIYALCASYDTELVDCLYMGGSVMSWGMICYFISRQESILFELKSSEQEAREIHQKDNKTSTEDQDLAIDLSEAIQQRFIIPQIYLRPDLKLRDMAETVGTNRTYLSRYLNERLQTTFYDYVNSLRLQHAIDLMASSEYSIQAIATIAGFNSYSTFRRTFIAKYGKSPQEYKYNINDYDKVAVNYWIVAQRMTMKITPA